MFSSYYEEANIVLSDANQNRKLEDLVKKAAAGNEAAFGEIYDLYFEKVFRFIYWRVNHRQEAEDLVAETFVRVWGKLAKISDPASFSGWLFQIARNLVIDHYRSRKVNVDLAALENILEYEVNVLDQVNFGFRQREFLQALEILPPDQQTVIKLKFLDELDNAEIAAVLGKSEGAIRVIQHRALATLKNLVNREDEDHEE